MKRALLACLASAGLVLAPVANATPQQDSSFFILLRAQGIEPGPTAVENAHVICNRVWSGEDPNVTASGLRDVNPDMTFDAARNFVASALIVYCPPQANGPAQAPSSDRIGTINT